MAETHITERPKSQKTIEENIKEVITNAGYEIMFGRKEGAAEFLKLAKDSLKDIRIEELKEKYKLFYGKYVSRWGELK